MKKSDFELTPNEEDEILNISGEILDTIIQITKELITDKGLLATDVSLVQETIDDLFL